MSCLLLPCSLPVSFWVCLVGPETWNQEVAKISNFVWIFLIIRLAFSKQPVHVFHHCLSQHVSTIFGNLPPRKNVDTVKFSDPKSRNVEEIFLFLKFNGAFHDNCWLHFSHKIITRLHYHFSLQTWKLVVAFVSSNRNCSVQKVSKITHR